MPLHINDEYDIGKAFSAIEEELISSMIRNMRRHKLEEIDEGMQWTMWQSEQLRSLEKYKKTNQKKYGRQFADINSSIDVLIRMARDEGEMQQEIAILNAIKKGFPAKRVSKGVAAEFFKLNERKLEVLIKATKNDMEKAEIAVLRMAEDQYRKTIFNAQVYANTGAGTYEKAVDMATKDFLSAGLNCIEYANGARHTLADYADMAIRTASKRAYLQGEGTKRNEWGIHTVIVNKRGNPCPKCLPFCGKVLIDDVWSGGSSKDGSYPLMSHAISRGLYHPRCKDSHTTYFPGISTAEDTWTQEELEKIDLRTKEESKQQYVRRQKDKYGRLAEYSLDEENRNKYKRRKEIWEKQVIDRDSDELSVKESKMKVVDVTEEYLKAASPKKGLITYDEGYKTGRHKEEIKIANWLHDTFGGDIKLLNESGDLGVKTSDFSWREKMWELKTTSTPNATDNAVRKAMKQIRDNPGGIILDYGDNEIDIETLQDVITRRIMRCGIESVDIMLLSGGKVLKILRYKK